MIYIAAMMSIDLEQYEAADIDGSDAVEEDVVYYIAIYFKFYHRYVDYQYRKYFFRRFGSYSFNV